MSTNKKDNLILGAFSISLNVKDIERSKTFYEKLGFQVFAGDVDQKYLIMRNKQIVIGLFQGMLEGNLLTFNPGWDQDCNALETYDDVRVIQEHLQANGITLTNDIDVPSTGPASITLSDPDGNQILIDQHV